MAGFTSIAAGISGAATVATTVGSFAQASEQNSKKKKAEEAAAAAMMEARKKLDVNYYEQLGIQKEPYELARRELLSQGALATQQLAEGDPRALAAGVGRVQLAQQLGQEKVATAMQQEQTALEKLVAGEESRLRDLGTQLDLQEAVGAQQAAADAERAEFMAMQQGFAGVTSLGSQLTQLAPLYAKTTEVNTLDRIKRQAAKEGIDPKTLDLSNPNSLKAAGIQLTPKQLASIPTKVTSVSQFEEYNKTGAFSTPKAPTDSGASGDLGPVSRTPTYGIDPTNPFGISLNPTTGVNMPTTSSNVFQKNNQSELMKVIQELADKQGVTIKEFLDKFNNILPQDPTVNQGQQVSVPVSSYGYGFNPIN